MGGEAKEPNAFIRDCAKSVFGPSCLGVAASLQRSFEVSFTLFSMMTFDPPLQTVAFDQPLIYMWEIRGQSGELLGRYVGKAKAGAKRPLEHYKRNVQNFLDGKPYRKNNPQGYRRIHRALADAQECGHRIVLSFLCSIQAGKNIDSVERQWIAKQNSCGGETWQLNG